MKYLTALCFSISLLTFSNSVWAQTSYEPEPEAQSLSQNLSQTPPQNNIDNLKADNQNNLKKPEEEIKKSDSEKVRSSKFRFSGKDNRANKAGL